ncbi:MAG: hypothetical protein LUE29_08425 [Lachnospiraceae bacterium]|nr:hypothetical protein [Lachnospiraceae bacterium]
MKCFFRVCSYETCHSLLTRRFLGTAAAFTAMLLLDSATEICFALFQDSYMGDICSLALNSMLGYSYMFWLRFCLFALPYGCSFFDEYSAKTAKYRLIRTSSVAYGTAKMVTNALLSAAAVFLSQMLYLIVMLALGFPLLEKHNQYIAEYTLLAAGHAAGFYLLLSVFNCFAAVFFSSLTMMLSAFLRNKYILLAMPLTLFFCLDYFGGLWYPNGSTGNTVWTIRSVFFRLHFGTAQDTEFMAFCRTGLLTLVAFAIFTCIFVRRIRKVVETE